ncbi:MAG: hypothetical protein A2268_01125 [Candidatus Raymondbacteria bacterium RifOxyA12_full_50_37]|uniref:TPM domain-containing protein n=1 Tax=Candidatus Raymondbacteria bacterium RIFOXYD12_FULL_49_13 TaxID=1817890 RepID=A0A1F7FFR0_UNCRA|nr:MAG: hypothetical protein A2268_01125 [Candidatus Raymondbacteria bacterium RifOxyA12_full_50_37]OGJ86405.1 MAG: hypothetical protein A2248_14090 [Candidatus Raymondbacteria bacterium RIFOXYA2_FULL_49_16]OGJ95575.1 MAG: hypothetical protein A2453_12865 [Candidatus Raymondbacteria bacterium RIFOXYC2_FULL_50_21]OGK02401.1 MAG: hypothetical protein A2350_03025 [Candidatus Raymondbacteria bacterium RifOxyB12_full_50_8]OGK05534.1 MAG: hypothetical protein A2519_05450 [Candidatus Raymondbacteria b
MAVFSGVLCVFFTLVSAVWSAENEALFVNEAQFIGGASDANGLSAGDIRDALWNELSKTGKYAMTAEDSVLSSPELKDMSRSVLYNPSSASYFGSRIGVTLVVLTRARFIDNNIFFQAGLFDVEMAEMIAEAKVSCPNNESAIRQTALPELARGLSGIQQETSAERASGSQKPRFSNSLKWMAIGAAIVTFSYFTINAALKPEPEPSPTSQTNIDLSW